MAIVKLENINKIYEGNVVAVKDASLEIHDREFMVLVGPSGCGKSTLLRMIAGLEEITAGEISIDNVVVNRVAPKDRDIAMVFQNYALYPHMTVYENMAFGLKLRRFTKEEIDARVLETARILGLMDLLKRRPKHLSGGQRQRVAVGRAIVRKPKAFLFDEPLSNLDAKMRVQMRTEISKLHQHLESTIIYVTHDQTEAMTMGDRICVMNEGIIQQVASPLEIYDHPCNQFVAGFIGTPQMNFFDGIITHRNQRLIFFEPGLEFELPIEWQGRLGAYIDKNVVFGIRAEDIGEDGENFPRLQGIVEVIEPMGSDMLVYLTTGKNNFVARLDPHHPLRVGEHISFPMRLRHAHFFDAQSQLTII